MSSNKSVSSFHSYYDSNVYANETYTAAQGWTNVFPPIISVETRSLGYRFYPHFHPYVLALVRRLNAGGVSGLQGADTDYKTNSDGSFTTLPNSTRATALATIQATRQSDSTALTILAGAPLTLNDGTVVTIPNLTGVTLLDGTASTISPATNVTLPGSIPASVSSGTQFAPGGGSVFVLPDSTAVVLPNTTQAALSDGTLVTLPAASQVGLRSGVPLPKLYEAIFSSANYAPTALVQKPYPVKDLDFTISGAYSIYNWELFFHIPLLIAIHLSQNQQYQDAQNWFHYIFDPTDNSNGPTPERFWKVNPFQTTDVTLIEKILLNLSTGVDPQLQQDTTTSIAAWKDNPFQPFVVGRYRPTAFMFKTVMAYLDNLIAWGDSLFQQYTIETINEATQLYVLAANILGPRPQAVPKKGSVGPQTYADLRSSLDPFSNALRDMEVDIPFDAAPHPPPVDNNGGGSTLGSIGQTLYFCIPRNDQLLAYWDTVADRLFKIHNSLNLQGVFQQLPLFDPPIDPALLVRAAAAGLDVSAIVNGLNQPLPLVRFQLLATRASEITQEVKSLGGNLLAAMEKGDNEAITLLRAQHETIILGLAEMVKYAQAQEAIKAREALQVSLANAVQRFTFYQRQLGVAENAIAIPSLDDLDENSLETFSFQSSEPAIPFLPYTVDISQDSASLSDGAIRTISSHEAEEMNKLSIAHDFQISASVMEGISSGLSMVPQFNAHAQPLGVGATVGFGGVQLSKMISALASVARLVSEQFSYEASKAGKLGVYSRRELEWINLSNAAIAEMNLIFKQIRAAQIREAIAQKEYKNHKVQMQQAQDVENVLKNKETNQAFYVWMKRQVKSLYTRSFQLAFEVARKAERALQNELGDPTQSFIQFTYLDGIEGLLAGEKLLLDIKRMEMAYLDLNRREYELTKQVSLLQVAPLALVQLRATGSCTLSLSEDVFDLDGPGHYFRRIKSVAVSIPCVAGPYTSVNCTLTLLNSSIRTSSQLSDNGYPRSGSEDARFSDNYGSIQAIVTSSGQADNGLFENNLHDERYLPFEFSGAISQWRLDLPSDVRQFDFDTIADVILHIRYTAREGGELLKSGAVKNLQTLIDNAQTVGSVRLFSVRHEFPSDWAKFRAVTIAGPTLTAGLSLTLLSQHYPFWAQGMVGKGPVKAVHLIAEMLPTDKAVTVNLFGKADKTGPSDALNQDPLTGNLLVGNLVTLPLPSAVTDATHPPLTLYFDDNAIKELWLAITWGKA